VNAGSLIILLALFAVLWLVMIRPQRARQQRQQQMLDTVTPGDEVLTVGGLYGIVQSTDEEGDLIVEIADGIHVRIARRSVATVIKPEDEDDQHEGVEHPDDGEEEHAYEPGQDGGVRDRADQAVVVDDGDASLEATQRRLFGRRR
jgi:preprotein translocase subunit YajC